MPRAKKITEVKAVKKVSKPKKTTEVESESQTTSSTVFSTINKIENISVKKKTIILLSIAILAVLGYLIYKLMIVAWVDNTPITRMQLDKTLEEKYGKDLKEQLISERLISQEAKKRGVNATSQDIDTQIKKIEDQQGGADKLNQLLQMQAMTRKDLTDQIKYQILIEKMFGSDASTTPQEISDYIDKNKDQFADFKDDDSSESAQIKQGVADSLKRQKVGQNFNTWLKQELQGKRVVRL